MHPDVKVSLLSRDSSWRRQHKESLLQADHSLLYADTSIGAHILEIICW